MSRDLDLPRWEGQRPWFEIWFAVVLLGRPLARGDVILTGTPAGVGLRMSPLQRRVVALVKDRFRKAEPWSRASPTSTALLRSGDVIDVDVGLAGRIRTGLGV